MKPLRSSSLSFSPKTTFTVSRIRFLTRLLGTGLLFCLGSMWYSLHFLDLATTNETWIPSKEQSQQPLLRSRHAGSVEESSTTELQNYKNAVMRRLSNPETSTETTTTTSLTSALHLQPHKHQCGRGSLCDIVGAFVQSQRNDILQEVSKSEWAWYLPYIAQYYRQCVVVPSDENDVRHNGPVTTTIVEVGEPSSGYGASAQYMLQTLGGGQHQHRVHSSPTTNRIQYYVFDSFRVTKGMQRVFRLSAPKATAADLSQAWADSMLDGTHSIQQPTATTASDGSGVQLQIYRTTSSRSLAETIQEQQLLPSNNIYAMYIDNLSSLQEQQQDRDDTMPSISETMKVLVSHIRPGGTLILGFDPVDGGNVDEDIRQVLQQHALIRNIDVRVIDKFHPAVVEEALENAFPATFSCSDNHPVLKQFQAWTPVVSEVTSKKKRMKLGHVLTANQNEVLAYIDAQFVPPDNAVQTTGLVPSINCTRNAAAVTAFCSNPKLNTWVAECMSHQRSASSLSESFGSLKGNDVTATKSRSTCKTLWFAGFHEGLQACQGREKYAQDYSAALSSAMENAGDSLQPVLLLGRYGLESENSTELSLIGRWARDRGAKVVVLPRLSFQEHVDLSAHGITGPNRYQFEMGPFMRLDIPKIVKQYGLMDDVDDSICKDHVLYTDPDVLFTGKITTTDLDMLKEDLNLSKAVVSYGREYDMGSIMHNTGVMVMNVKAFENEWPDILDFTLKRQVEGQPFPLHDQVMLNSYFEEAENADKRTLLSLFWNWKAYWMIQPSRFEEVKILHFHGPKPNKALEEMAFCQTEQLDVIGELFKDYEMLVLHGICCDQGRTAYHASQLFKRYSAALDDICE